MIKTYKSNDLKSTKLTRISQYHQSIWNKMNGIGYLPSDNKYNLTISRQKMFIWFRNAKVGTRTIFKIFKESGLLLDAEHPYGCYYPPVKYKSYFKFAFVRNPWDRLISCWNDKVIKGNLYNFSDTEREKMMNIENFIDYVNKLDLFRCDSHLRLQSSLIDLNNIDFLGRYENFIDDLSYVLKALDINISGIPVVNKGQRTNPDYRTYFSQSSAQKVADLYARDIRIFGYKY